RRLLPGPRRLCLADAAARLPALEDGVVLLLHLAGRRRLGGGPPRAAGGPAAARRPGADAQRRRPGQPVGQDDRGGRPAGVRRGEKKLPAASGTCWLTPSA